MDISIVESSQANIPPKNKMYWVIQWGGALIKV